jgi:hypothetical protein
MPAALSGLLPTKVLGCCVFHLLFVCFWCLLLQNGTASSAEAAPAAGAAAPAVAAAAAAAAAVGVAGDQGSGDPDVLPEEGAEVEDSLLAPPPGASPGRRTSPRLQARQQQREGQPTEQQPFGFTAGAAAAATAGADGVAAADTAAVGAPGTGAQQSSRQQQRRQEAVQQQEQERQQQQGSNADAADTAAAAAATEVFAEALAFAEDLIGSGVPAEGAYEQLASLYDVSCSWAAGAWDTSRSWQQLVSSCIVCLCHALVWLAS